MFLTDSLFNNRSTEPIWFQFFRGSFAIILAGILVYYSVDNFNEINNKATLTINPELLECNVTKKNNIYMFFK